MGKFKFRRNLIPLEHYQSVCSCLSLRTCLLSLSLYFFLFLASTCIFQNPSPLFVQKKNGKKEKDQP